jgi:hypothetical protein
MTELSAIEKNEGEYLTLEEFLKLEYKEVNRETLKQDLAYIVNNFHNLTREFQIEPVKNFYYLFVEYDSTTIKRGEGKTTRVRTPVPTEQKLNERGLNNLNTLATVKYGDTLKIAQPIFDPQHAPIYLAMTQSVLVGNIASNQNEE